MDEAQFLVFALGGEHFALPLAGVREVLALPRLEQPPGLPGLLAGFVNFGGEVLPVLQLADLLQLPVLRSIDQHLILLRERALLCLVDRVLGIERAAPAALEAGHSFNELVSGRLESGAFVLQPERLLLAEEAARVEELRGMAAERLQRLETL